MVGKDISEVMHSEAPHKHTEYAWRVLESLRVGTLMDAVVTKTERQKYDSMVDVNAPFLWQMGDLGENYHGWMASQPVVRNLTIFPWKAVEDLSRYPWWWIWFAMPPSIAYGITTASAAGLGLSGILAGVALGLCVWIALEYALHRFVFHIEAGTYGMNIFHFFAHGLHHLTPHDTSRLTFPPPFVFILATLFWNSFKLILMGHPIYSTVFSGFASGYVMYDTTHFLYHHTDGTGYGPLRFPKFFTSYLKFMKSCHNVHHFINDDCNFGVSSPILDFVLGTYVSKKDAELMRMEKAAKKKLA
eukprot:TRINITY_DN13727_c0_g1_i3.p1 TRINITY_DN13727_c0_g1~~TRINITY_DN13727_c0_g1_i3.p1  ORF type:complete len:302 (+),score=71.12 TRINITY_DN13727_c0_g1_i3:153-1058(+)